MRYNYRKLVMKLLRILSLFTLIFTLSNAFRSATFTNVHLALSASGFVGFWIADTVITFRLMFK